MKARALAGFLFLLLQGCGAPIGERVEADTWQRYFAATQCCDRGEALRVLAHERRHGDQTWAPPQLVVAKGVPAGQWLPGDVLMRVEVSIYPKVSCNGKAPPRVPPPQNLDSGAPRVDARALERLGKPERVAEIWVVPFDAPPQFKHRVGPGWFGRLLREAGEGGAVLLPSYQDCGAMRETFPLELPQNVFFGGGIPPRRGMHLEISARSPVVARVLEVCKEARISQRKEILVSYQVPIATWGYSVGFREERRRYTDRVEAQCAGGARRFDFGPVREGFSLADDPPEKLTIH